MAHGPRTGPCPYVVSSPDAHLPAPVIFPSQCAHVAILARGRARTRCVGPALARRATWRARGERGCRPSARPVTSANMAQAPGTPRLGERANQAEAMPPSPRIARPGVTWWRPRFPARSPSLPAFSLKSFGGFSTPWNHCGRETQACRQGALPPSPWGTWPGCYPGGFARSVRKEEPFLAGASWEERSAPQHGAWLLEAEAQARGASRDMDRAPGSCCVESINLPLLFSL